MKASKTPGGLRRADPRKVPAMTLQDLPNVGPATEKDLLLLGIKKPEDLRGKNHLALYQRLCKLTGKKHDVCVLDVFESIVEVANGAPSRPWWFYSRKRKASDC